MMYIFRIFDSEMKLTGIMFMVGTESEASAKANELCTETTSVNYRTVQEV